MDSYIIAFIKALVMFWLCSHYQSSILAVDLHSVDSSICPPVPAQALDPDTPSDMPWDRYRRGWSHLPAGTPHSSPDDPSVGNKRYLSMRNSEAFLKGIAKQCFHSEKSELHVPKLLSVSLIRSKTEALKKKLHLKSTIQCFKDVKIDRWPDLSYSFLPIDCCVRINGKPDCLFSGDIQS